MRTIIWSGLLNSAPPDTTAPESGAQSLVGYVIDLTPDDGSARVILQIEDKHINRNGSLHGGIVAMMLDSAAGFAVSRRLSPNGDARVVTVALNNQYLAPGQHGTTVIATGRVSGGGRKIIYSDAELRDETGTLLAKASGVFKAVGPKP